MDRPVERVGLKRVRFLLNEQLVNWSCVANLQTMDK